MKHRIHPENALKIAEWFRTRGGIAIWSSANLSNPLASWTTPALTLDGTPTSKPTWQASETPRILTHPADVEVCASVEVQRFHVAVRAGSNGATLKLTDASTARVRRAVATWSSRREPDDGAWYEFDYTTQEAVILVAGHRFSLLDYVDREARAVVITH